MVVDSICKGYCEECSDPCRYCNRGICEQCVYGYKSNRDRIELAIKNAKIPYNPNCVFINDTTISQPLINKVEEKNMKSTIPDKKEDDYNKEDFTLKLTKKQMEYGMEKLIEDLNWMRDKISKTSAYTPEETEQRFKLIKQEKYLRDILYNHFDIQLHEYKDKHFVEIN